MISRRFAGGRGWAAAGRVGGKCRHLLSLPCLLLLPVALPHAATAVESDLIPGEERPSQFTPPLEVTPAAEPTVTDGTESGVEQAGGSYSLTSPNGVIYDMANGLALAQGNVGFTYREFTVKADRGLVDYNKNEAILSGNLTVTVRGRVITGKTLTFDLDSGRWTLRQSEIIFPPDFFPSGTVLSPIYVTGSSVSGQDDVTGSGTTQIDNTIVGNNFRFSSCDREHYYIQSKRLDFYRDPNGEPDRIALHQNGLYVFGKKVVSLPVYVISLSGARSRRIGLQPIVGQNTTDGVFVKTTYDLAANAKRTDTLLIDALQKRGLGLGIQRELANKAGLFYLYMLSGKTGGREINSRIDRNWNITPNLKSNLNFQSTQNNSFGGEGVKSQNGNLQFNYNTPNVQSNVFLRYSDSSSSFSKFKSYGTTLQHRQDFGAGWSLDANSLYAGSTGSGGSRSATLDNTFVVANSSKLFDLFLKTELHDDLTNTIQRNGAYQLERVPEFGFTSDTERLGLGFLNRTLPGDLRFSYGRFNEPQTVDTTRTDFNYAARQRDFQLLKLGPLSTRLITQGNFEQSFYGTDTARYNYNYNLGVENKLGGFRTQINYFRQKSLGYTPFQFDYVTPAEYADATLSYSSSDKFRFNLTAGKDFQNDFTRDIDARVQWVPSPSFYASVGTTYSPETKDLGDIVGNFRLARDKTKFLGGTLDLGVRYSSQLSQFSRINASLDLYADKKTRIQALSGYNGFAKQFDFNQIRITRDLHCFNLFATYDSTLKQFRLDLALKAFPFTDTRYGVGQQGQGFDARIGDFQ